MGYKKETSNPTDSDGWLHSGDLGKVQVGVVLTIVEFLFQFNTECTIDKWLASSQN